MTRWLFTLQWIELRLAVSKTSTLPAMISPFLLLSFWSCPIIPVSLHDTFLFWFLSTSFLLLVVVSFHSPVIFFNLLFLLNISLFHSHLPSETSPHSSKVALSNNEFIFYFPTLPQCPDEQQLHLPCLSLSLVFHLSFFTVSRNNALFCIPTVLTGSSHHSLP